jgi:hypothetical protein
MVDDGEDLEEGEMEGEHNERGRKVYKETRTSAALFGGERYANAPFLSKKDIPSKASLSNDVPVVPLSLTTIPDNSTLLNALLDACGVAHSFETMSSDDARVVTHPPTPYHQDAGNDILNYPPPSVVPIMVWKWNRSSEGSLNQVVLSRQTG